MTVTLFVGQFVPIVASVLGFLYLVARCIYCRGYAYNGPKGRKLGGKL